MSWIHQRALVPFRASNRSVVVRDANAPSKILGLDLVRQQQSILTQAITHPGRYARSREVEYARIVDEVDAEYVAVYNAHRATLGDHVADSLAMQAAQDKYAREYAIFQHVFPSTFTDIASTTITNQQIAGNPIAMGVASNIVPVIGGGSRAPQRRSSKKRRRRRK